MTGDLPPVLGPSGAPTPVEEPGPPPPAPSRIASGLALVILSAYIAVPALLGATRSQGEGALLPETVRGILVTCGLELGLFAAAFALARALGRLRAPDLLLAWRGPWVIPRALGWSLALRFGIGLALATALGIWHLVTGGSPGNLGNLRPNVEAMVNIEALRDPVYLFLMLTLVSFVLAGLREELWRISMVRLLGHAFPRAFAGRRGPWLALVPVAVLFGLAHTAQGWVGVVATSALGLGLGAIMLLHRSLWDAVLAHGFFNAATFAALPWLAQYLAPRAGG